MLRGTVANDGATRGWLSVAFRKGISLLRRRPLVSLGLLVLATIFVLALGQNLGTSAAGGSTSSTTSCPPPSTPFVPAPGAVLPSSGAPACAVIPPAHQPSGGFVDRSHAYQP
jgi:hypothetical protein